MDCPGFSNAIGFPGELFSSGASRRTLASQESNMSTPQSPQGDPNQPEERIAYVEKKKKGGCMKWGAIIIGAIILIIILATAFGGGDDSDSDSSSDAQNDSEAEQVEEGTDFALGETYTTGDGMEIVVNNFSLVSDALGQNACADVTYTNNGDEQTSFQGYWDWKAQNPAGVITDPTFGGDNSLSSGDLAPGGTVSGSVCFDSTEPGEYRLVYEPTLSFSGDTATWVANL